MKIAIVGATGEVGRMMVNCLSEANLNIQTLDLYASARSAGATVFYNDESLIVKELKTSALLQHYDYVLFSAGTGIALSYAPLAETAGSVVIDNSSAFRMNPAIPLVVPEINSDLLTAYRGIVANPNCSTIQAVLPLAILDKAWGLKKVIYNTWQSVSGSGFAGISSLMEQRKGSSDKGIYPRTIDLNVIPQIGGFSDDGYSQEEQKMQDETRKILRLPDLQVSATAVRVPVIYGHCVSIYAEFDSPCNLAQAEKLLGNAESINYLANTYITPLELGNSDDSHVCRLRMGCDEHSLVMWNVGHNVRLGAATNAVRILQKHLELNS